MTLRFLLLAGLAVPAMLHAQTAPASPAPDIVVTGRGLDPEPERRGYDSVTLDRQRITGTASNRLEDALADVAGLQSFRRADSRSANQTSQGLTLRGIGGNAASRALLVLDGVPQADPFAGWIAFPGYDPARLGAIRIVRGGGSAVWGPGAETGTVELISATPSQLDPVAASLAYGSRHSVDASGSVSLVRPGGFLTLSAGYQRGDGFIPIEAADRGAVDKPAPYRQFSQAVRGVVAVATDTELQATLQHFTDRRDRGLPNTANSSAGTDASLRVVGNGRFGWSVLGYVQSRAFTSQFASIDDARTTSTLTLNQYDVPGTGIGGRVELSPSIGGGVTLRLGGDARALSGETRELATYVAGSPTRQRAAGGRTLTTGGYADLAFPLGPLSADLNGRLDAWSITGGHLVERVIATGALATDEHDASRHGVEPTGRFGLGWKPFAGLGLRAAAYRGWRLPTINELYRPFRAGADGTAANPALQPEALVGAEAGLDLAPAKGITLSATGFANRLDHAIANVTVAKGPYSCPGVGTISAAGFCRRRDNVDAIEAWGAELEAAARRGDAGLRLSYAYTHSRVRASGSAAALDGLVPAQTPTHQASATLDWSPARGARAALTGRYISAQFEDDQDSRTLRRALTLDATASLPLAAGVRLEGRAENLFDATVDTGFSNDARERAHPQTLWLGLRVAG